MFNAFLLPKAHVMLELSYIIGTPLQTHKIILFQLKHAEHDRSEYYTIRNDEGGGEMSNTSNLTLLPEALRDILAGLAEGRKLGTETVEKAFRQLRDHPNMQLDTAGIIGIAEA